MAPNVGIFQGSLILYLLGDLAKAIAVNPTCRLMWPHLVVPGLTSPPPLSLLLHFLGKECQEHAFIVYCHVVELK
jgi:hypothetical protein